MILCGSPLLSWSGKVEDFDDAAPLSPTRFGAAGLTESIKELWRKDFEPDNPWMMAICYWSDDGREKMVTFFRLSPWTTSTARDRLHAETPAIDFFSILNMFHLIDVKKILGVLFFLDCHHQHLEHMLHF